MASLYKYYQLVGGEEEWHVTYDTENLDDKKPTFITALSVDVILDKESSKEVKEKAKYQGPLYFDLDSDTVEDSLTAGKELLEKLKSKGLQDCDIQIYLSGKKGMHFIIPQVCFMQKIVPVQGLPAIYKEIAFTFAVDTMDFRVYTAKRGRMFRTCYNQRENGNYKVPVTAAELALLNTAEDYNAMCAAPRAVGGHNPQFRTPMALLFDAAHQKVAKNKPKPRKPVSPQVLAEQLGIVDSVVSSDKPLIGGFNIIAMQLSLYAREAAWTEDMLLAKCEPLLRNHVSDGSRYNSYRRRENELRRMFNYVDENAGLEYNPAGLKALLGKQAPIVSPNGDPDDEDATAFEMSAGVTMGRSCYLASRGGDEGDVPISNYVFKNAIKLLDFSTGRIRTIRAEIMGGVPRQRIDLVPAAFTSSSAQQNIVNTMGGSFTGTDMHARGVYQLMLKEVSQSKFIIDTEGINLVRMQTQDEDDIKEFIVWADRSGIRSSNPSFNSVTAAVTFEFEGYPDPLGTMRTDLLRAPELSTWMETADLRERFMQQVENLLHSHTPEVIGKMLGWAVACFYKPLFVETYQKFPLLHVYGPAGSGKSESTMGIMRLFYYLNDPQTTTPDSTAFALQMLLGGSESIPLMVDEYKPHTMSNDKLEQVRALLRAAYNSKEIQRGGGNRQSTDKFNALNKQKLSAPLIFIAEAPETETAIVERSVMVSFKRLTGRQQSHCFKHALLFYADTTPMASIGLAIASKVVATEERSTALQDFERLHAWATRKFLPQADDGDLLAAGKLTPQDIQIKSVMRPRNVYNAAVACFGLSKLKELLVANLGEETYKHRFEEIFKAMSTATFLGMDALAAATVPEYIKVLQIMSDMTRFEVTDPHRLIVRDDYSITEFADRTVLVIAAKLCYRKYRAYMKHVASTPLYPSDTAFEIALRDVPQFIRMADATENKVHSTIVLDLEELVRAGVQAFHGKHVDNKFLSR